MFFIKIKFKSTTNSNVSHNITCDFDLLELVNDPMQKKAILAELPKLCKELETNSELHGKMIEESKKFQVFTDKLDAFEQEHNSGGSDAKGANDEVTEKDWNARNQLYNTVDIFICGNLTTNNNDFIDCKISKRDELIQNIDNL